MKSCFIWLALLCLAAIACAQSVSSASFTTLCGGIGLRSVKGIPFSADVIKESVQTSADGSQVRHASVGKMVRDSQGRTRVETHIEAQGSGSEPRLWNHHL